jgi:hypothetical protein
MRGDLTTDAVVKALMCGRRGNPTRSPHCPPLTFAEAAVSAPPQPPATTVIPSSRNRARTSSGTPGSVARWVNAVAGALANADTVRQDERLAVNFSL